MNYKFPVIQHISQVLPIIADRKEFVVAEKEGGYTVINYVVQMADTFPPVNGVPVVSSSSGLLDEDGNYLGDIEQYKIDMSILRELRGLVFNTETGKVISRRYHKFFNVNEKAETQLSEIDFSKPHVILEKLDGSMITPIPVNGEIRWGTKMGVTDVAKPVEEFVAARSEYIEYAEVYIDGGATPIFEWCSRQQAIVIDYPEDMLVLTAIRDNATGEYLPYNVMVREAKAWGIPVVKAFQGTAKNMQDLIDQTSVMVGCEGFVVRFDDGHMLKVKAEDYLRKHRAKDSLGREKNVIELIVTEKIDDVKAFLDAKDLARVEAFEKAFWNGMQDTEIELLLLRKQATDMKLDVDKRTYAVEFVQALDEKVRPFMYRLFDTKVNTMVLLKNAVAASTGTQTKIDECRWMFGCNWAGSGVEAE